MTTPPRARARVVDRAPSSLPLMLKATLPAVPLLNHVPALRRSGSELPDLTLTRHDVVIDREHVAAYAEVCGFPLDDSLPVTYPHVLAFPLHLAIMTDRSFPVPAIGLVHLENTITRHRAVTLDERLQVTARPDNLRAHPKGWLFDIAVEVHSAGELVWSSTSSLLRLGGGDPDAPREASGRTFEEVPANHGEWRLPGNLGRQYAAVSGDHNPIHLYLLTARAFGFSRQIAHGMWSKARCLAALQGRLPDAVKVEAAFRKPILLPGAVSFGSSRSGDGYAFSLTSRSGGTHLLGRTTPLT